MCFIHTCFRSWYSRWNFTSYSCSRHSWSFITSCRYGHMLPILGLSTSSAKNTFLEYRTPRRKDRSALALSIPTSRRCYKSCPQSSERRSRSSTCCSKWRDRQAEQRFNKTNLQYHGRLMEFREKLCIWVNFDKTALHHTSLYDAKSCAVPSYISEDVRLVRFANFCFFTLQKIHKHTLIYLLHISFFSHIAKKILETE